MDPGITFYEQIETMLQRCQKTPQCEDNFPEQFIAFLNEREIDQREFFKTIPRYIRVRPGCTVTAEQLLKELRLQAWQIAKVDEQFWAIDPNARINRCQLYEQGIIHGMDVSSAMAARCLQVQPCHRVLELCSAPGNKSMYIAQHYPSIKIIGVEISQNRANIMRNLVRKYKLDSSIEVVVADGVTYCNEQHFDRVLVDAECTHEGSLKHLLKFRADKDTKRAAKNSKRLTKQQKKQFKQNNSNIYTSQINKANSWSQEDFEERFLDKFKLENLELLQTGLLLNAFILLKPGGILVYSTCSYDRRQNQDIVFKLLKQNPEAQLLDAGQDISPPIVWKSGKLKGTIYFTPVTSGCGGMFIAKMCKTIAARQENKEIESVFLSESSGQVSP